MLALCLFLGFCALIVHGELRRPARPRVRTVRPPTVNVYFLLVAEARQHPTWTHYAAHVLRCASLAYRGGLSLRTPVLARAMHASWGAMAWSHYSVTALKLAGCAWTMERARRVVREQRGAGAW